MSSVGRRRVSFLELLAMTLFIVLFLGAVVGVVLVAVLVDFWLGFGLTCLLGLVLFWWITLDG